MSTLALRLGRHVSLAEIFEPLLLHMYEIASHLGDKGPRGTCILLARQAILFSPLPFPPLKPYGTRGRAPSAPLYTPPGAVRGRAGADDGGGHLGLGVVRSSRPSQQRRSSVS